MFCMAVPSESVAVGYLCQIVELHSRNKILRSGLVLDGDTAHPVYQSTVTALKAMQIR